MQCGCGMVSARRRTWAAATHHLSVSQVACCVHAQAAVRSVHETSLANRYHCRQDFRCVRMHRCKFACATHARPHASAMAATLSVKPSSVDPCAHGWQFSGPAANSFLLHHLHHHLMAGCVQKARASASSLVLAGTPATRLQALLDALVHSEPVSLQEVVALRAALRHGGDLHRPLDLAADIRAADMDAEVADALLAQLTSQPRPHTDGPQAAGPLAGHAPVGGTAGTKALPGLRVPCKCHLHLLRAVQALLLAARSRGATRQCRHAAHSAQPASHTYGLRFAVCL